MRRTCVDRVSVNFGPTLLLPGDLCLKTESAAARDKLPPFGEVDCIDISDRYILCVPFVQAPGPHSSFILRM